MREWLAHFATIGQALRLEELILFGDCYYLPHEEGPEAEALYQLASRLIVNYDAPTGSAGTPTGTFPDKRKKLTDKDFALAKKIEQAVLWRPEPGGPLTGTPDKFVQGKK